MTCDRQHSVGCSRALSPACAGSSLRDARVRSSLPAVQPWRQVLAAAGGHVCGCQRDHCAAATALVGALGCGLVWCSMPSLAQPPTHLLQFEGGPGLPEAGVMVCGDSGNDVELFAVPGAAGAGTARSLPVRCATGWASTGSALAQPPPFNLPPREGRSNPPDRGSSAQGALHARPRLLPAFLPPVVLQVCTAAWWPTRTRSCATGARPTRVTASSQPPRTAPAASSRRCTTSGTPSSPHWCLAC